MNEKRQPSPPITAQPDTAELEARLAAAKARKLAAIKHTEESEASRQLVLDVEAAERDAADAEAVLRATEEHGADKIAKVYTALGVVIVKRPNPVLYKRFRDKESTKTADLEQLVRPCIVYPDASRWDLICEEQPATLDRVADHVVSLAGFRGKELSGKS